MTAPRYLAPTSVEEATRLLADLGQGAWPIAGGTDLVVRMRTGAVRPAVLVDLLTIPGLGEIAASDRRLRIGATATIADVLDSPAVASLAPVLAEAAMQMGAVQLRNLATVGGNLASAVPSADLAPPLLVLEAVARIAGPGGDRAVPLDRFFVGPHRSALRHDEVLTALEIPLEDESTGAAFLKFGRRGAQVLAVVNAAAWVRMRHGVADDVRIALGAVAPTPIRARTAEDRLRGRRPSAEDLDEAASFAAAEARPISDMRASAEYRRALSRVLVRRALARAIERATGRLRHAV